jgi:hypothetical protein
MSMMKYFMSLLTAFKKEQSDDPSEPEKSDMFTSLAIEPITIWSEKVSGCGEDAEPIVFISEDGKFGMAAVFDGLGGGGAGRFETPDGSFSGARLAASIARTSLIRTIRRIWFNAGSQVEGQSSRSGPEYLTNERVSERRLPLSLLAELSRRNRKIDGVQGEVHTIEPGHAFRPEAYGAFATVPNPSLDDFDSSELGRSFDLSFTDAMARLGVQASSSRIKTRVKRHLPTTFAGAFFSERDNKVSLKVFWAGDSRIYILV